MRMASLPAAKDDPPDGDGETIISHGEDDTSRAVLSSKPSARKRRGSSGILDSEVSEEGPGRSKHAGPATTEKLNAMTPEERIEGLYDLHCVSGIIQETPEFVSKKLEELGTALESRKTPSPPSKLPGSEYPNLFKSAFLRVNEKYPEYVQAIRLRFLRAERFNVPNAAARLLRYAEVKQSFFGENVIGRDLNTGDFTEDDRQYVRTGFIQLFSQRDQKGRGVLMILGKMSAESPIETTLRILFLLIDAFAARDEGVQKNGMVLVYYGVGQKVFSKEQPMKCLDLCSALPIRVEAAHACYDDLTLQPLFDIASQLMTAECLVRFRAHFAPDSECQSILTSFGIVWQKELFPLRSDGSIRLFHLRTLMQVLGDETVLPREDEDNATLSSSFRSSSGALSSVASEATITDAASSRSSPLPSSQQGLQPGPNDIIMGRGRRGQKSAGNKRYRSLLRLYRARYEAANNFEKTLVAELVLKILREDGARFLKPQRFGDGSGWVEVSDEVAREKISHAFRNLRETEPNG